MACSASLLLKREGAPWPLEAGEQGLGSNSERSASLPLFGREKMCVCVALVLKKEQKVHSLILPGLKRMEALRGESPPVEGKSTQL